MQPPALSPDTTLLVQQEAFQGPLELLVVLLGKREVPAAAVQVLPVVERCRAACLAPPRDLARAGRYLWLAALLVLRKAHGLLPETPAPVSEPEAEEAPEMARRREQLLAAQALAGWLQDRRWDRGLWLRPPSPAPLSLPPSASPERLLEALQAAKARRPRPFPAPASLSRPTRPLLLPEQAILLVRRAVARRGRLTLFRRRPPARHVALFFAALELARQGEVHLEQARPFSPLSIRPRQGGSP